MRIKIQDIAYYLPEKVVTNESLAEDNPDWDIKSVEERSGVVKRHIAREDETALDLALPACNRLLENGSLRKDMIDGLIFCTQSGDYIIPPNSCLLHKELGLPDKVLAFDFNLGCSGFVYGLALAKGLLEAAIAKNILLVNADTYSKYISDKDRSARVLFGDGASASWISSSDSSKGIEKIECFTSGKGYEHFYIPAGGCKMPKSRETCLSLPDKSGNMRTLENIHMNGIGILTFVNTKVQKHIKRFLEDNSLTKDDIDLFVFHQASKLVINSLTRLLRLNPEKVFIDLASIGNTVSASIPIALKTALDKQQIVPGMKVLISGFGLGLSWGSAVIDF
ncbi:MAG: 3-oxoacyl-ACP synthase III family protein [bacterium]